MLEQVRDLNENTLKSHLFGSEHARFHIETAGILFGIVTTSCKKGWFGVLVGD